MKRTSLLLVLPALWLAMPQPAAAQGFFERLFGVPPRPQPGQPGQPVPQQPYRPQPQYRPPQQSPQQQRRPQPPQSQRPAAQQQPQQQAEPAPAVEPPPAPYEKELLRLAEIERLAGAYNKGYQAYALTYRVCTPSAQEASVRFLSEGEQLARNITGRYGG